MASGCMLWLLHSSLVGLSILITEVNYDTVTSQQLESE